MAAVLFGISGSALVAQYVIHHGTVWWNSPRAPRRYKGGFEQEMTRREAALILGVRESADKKVAMERYKKVMLLNHPDLGGSTFISHKINEAKDMLTKGKGRPG